MRISNNFLKSEKITVGIVVTSSTITDQAEAPTVIQSIKTKTSLKALRQIDFTLNPSQYNTDIIMAIVLDRKHAANPYLYP